jgi:hypothetical protein
VSKYSQSIWWANAHNMFVRHHVYSFGSLVSQDNAHKLFGSVKLDWLCLVCSFFVWQTFLYFSVNALWVWEELLDNNIMIKIKDDYDEIFWFRMIMMKIKDECFDDKSVV